MVPIAPGYVGAGLKESVPEPAIAGHKAHHHAARFQQLVAGVQGGTYLENMLGGAAVDDQIELAMQRFRQGLVQIMDMLGAFFGREIHRLHSRVTQPRE